MAEERWTQRSMKDSLKAMKGKGKNRRKSRMGDKGKMGKGRKGRERDVEMKQQAIN